MSPLMMFILGWLLCGVIAAILAWINLGPPEPGYRAEAISLAVLFGPISMLMVILASIFEDS